ncbi:MAG: hypothetical protein AAF368_07355 [Planctomycetota bacterium]
MSAWESVAEGGFHARRRVFKLFGNAVHLRDDAGRLVAYAEQKAFKLKEDLRLFATEARTEEVLLIRARQVIDFSGTYDVIDPRNGNEHVGTLQRKGLKSMVRDSWEILAPEGHGIGTMSEDSMSLALLRRFLSNWIPQRLDFEVEGELVSTYRGHFNPFIFKGDYEPVTGSSARLDPRLDPRLAVAAIVLYLCLEGRQD